MKTFGNFISIYKLPSEEWRRKHCHGYVKRVGDEIVWNEEAFQHDLKYTHGASYKCHYCQSESHWPRLTPQNLSGEDPIHCIICKK